MRSSTRAIVSLASALALTLALGACSNNSGAVATTIPTSPASPTPGATAPSISGISPSAPVAGTQLITVTGTNFGSGLTFVTKGPGTGATAYGGSTITAQTSTSFQVSVNFSVAGDWVLDVQNPDGSLSNLFDVTVQVPPGSTATPEISSISPSEPVSQNGTQMVTVHGTGFFAGLTFVCNGPGTGATAYSGSDLSDVTSTSFKANVRLNVSGQWNLSVQNANGNQSQVFSITVK